MTAHPVHVGTEEPAQASPRSSPWSWKTVRAGVDVRSRGVRASNCPECTATIVVGDERKALHARIGRRRSSSPATSASSRRPATFSGHTSLKRFISLCGSPSGNSAAPRREVRRRHPRHRVPPHRARPRVVSPSRGVRARRGADRRCRARPGCGGRARGGSRRSRPARRGSRAGRASPRRPRGGRPGSPWEASRRRRRGSGDGGSGTPPRRDASGGSGRISSLRTSERRWPATSSRSAAGASSRTVLPMEDLTLRRAAADHVVDELDVGAARDLGHDPTEARVQVDLARHHRRAHDAAVLDHRGRGLVARRLDPEDAHQVRRSSHDGLGGKPALDRRRAARRTRAGRPRAPTSPARPR